MALAGSAAPMLLIALPAPGHAQQATARFDIDAQSLSSALSVFARQSGRQLLYTPDLTQGRRAPALHETLPPELALSRLLRSSGLTFRQTPSGAFLLIAPRDRGGRTHTTSSQRAPDNGAPGDPAPPLTRADLPSAAAPDIVVVGGSLNTDIRRSENGARPYVVFSRQTIEQSGAQNLDDFLRQRLTAATSGASASQLGGRTGNASSINLRGLGADETLILVDGRRLAGFSVAGSLAQPDINGIPLSSVERIEVLPTSASGIYGGGATGGVINIILRRDYQGLEAKATYDGTFDGGGARKRIDLSGGFPLEGGKTRVMLSGAWSQSDPLLNGQRDYASKGRALTAARNPAFYYGSPDVIPVGATTNIVGYDPDTGLPANLVLKSGQALNSAYAHVATGATGAVGSGLIAGSYSLATPDTAVADGNRHSLLNASQVLSGMVSARREFTARLSGFVEFAASRNRSQFLTTQANSVFQLAASDPGNPFLQAIQVAVPAVGADQELRTEIQNYRVAGGFTWKLGTDWSLGADYTWNRSRYQATLPSYMDTDAAQAAISSGALSIFADPAKSNLDFSQFLYGRATLTPAATTLQDAVVRASGPLPVTLWGGAVRISGSLEHRVESYGGSRFSGTGSNGVRSAIAYQPQRQIVSSGYAELVLPVVSPGNHVPGIHLLEVQIAARHDEYRTRGSRQIAIADDGTPLEDGERTSSSFGSTNPTVALRYQPTQDLTLRGSYATGFLPPTVTQIVPSQSPLTLPGYFLSFLRDPRRGGEPVGATGTDFTLSYTGSGTLRPERSTSWSAGAILTPRFVPNLRLSVDWSRISKRDNIASLATLSSRDFTFEGTVPGLIKRGPVAPGDPYGVGPVTGIDLGLFNVSRLKVEALDFALDYSLVTKRIGTFNLTANATRVLSLAAQVTPGSPWIEYVGTGSAANVGGANDGGALKWKGTATLGWQINPDLTASWTARYFGPYFFDETHDVQANQGSDHIGSQIFNDLFASYRFALFGTNKSTRIEGGARNIFNASPRVDVIGTGFNPSGYSYFADPRGPSYYLTIRQNF